MITAVWEDITYTVSFNANGGSGTMASASVKDGDSMTLPACSFTPPVHQRFKAWLIDGGEYAPGDSFTVAENTAVIAVWEACYTISFLSNGAEGSMETVTVAQGETYILPECGFAPLPGQSFKCWRINGRDAAPGTRYTPAGDVELIAVWENIIYDISFDANGGSGTMASMQNIYGYVLTLPECAFDAPVGNRHFKAWQIGATEYQPNERYTLTGSVTIKALWEGNDHTLSYLWSYPVSVAGVESAHEYAPNLNRSWTVTVPGAASLSTAARRWTTVMIS